MATNRQYANVKPGKAEDLSYGHNYRSGWERDFARVLEFLQNWGVVEGWDYEPQRFDFQGLGYKLGPFVYTPDFVVKFNDYIDQKKIEYIRDILPVERSQTVYIEVKGQEKGKDRNKWRRFRKHTGNTLWIIKKEEMFLLQTKFKQQIPFWESNVRL